MHENKQPHPTIYMRYVASSMPNTRIVIVKTFCSVLEILYLSFFLWRSFRMMNAAYVPISVYGMHRDTMCRRLNTLYVYHTVWPMTWGMFQLLACFYALRHILPVLSYLPARLQPISKLHDVQSGPVFRLSGRLLSFSVDRPELAWISVPSTIWLHGFALQMVRLLWRYSLNDSPRKYKYNEYITVHVDVLSRSIIAIECGGAPTAIALSVT
jgi:hypothetical protein